MNNQGNEHIHHLQKCPALCPVLSSDTALEACDVQVPHSGSTDTHSESFPLLWAGP